MCIRDRYKAAADERGIDLDMDTARMDVYGMTYDEWKNTYQKESTAEQQEAFKKVMADPNLTT